MSVFRDTSAAIERAARLETARLEMENQALRAELEARARTENRDAYLERVTQERDELTRSLRGAKAHIEELERRLDALTHNRIAAKMPSAGKSSRAQATGMALAIFLAIGFVGGVVYEASHGGGSHVASRR
ncbi:MAG TPA: hypothetical protein VIF62_13765 [Labilithrix sp.]